MLRLVIHGHSYISNAATSVIFDSFTNFFHFSGDSSLYLRTEAGVQLLDVGKEVIVKSS